MIKYIIITVLTVICVKEWQFFVPDEYHGPKIGQISEFLRSHGYLVENHHVQTEDGYILTIHRVPNGRHKGPSNETASKPPVFLMHGLALSSIDWVVLGPDKSIGLILADAGYDVWMGNNRGNTHSRKHVALDPQKDKRQFYNYSYHEIGIYDLPAMINYVLNYTEYPKLSYIGYSEGVTSFLVMGAERPEYNKKILVMNGFTPVTDSFNVTSKIFNLLAAYPKLLKIAEWLGWYEMLDKTMAPIFRLICQSKTLCNVLFSLTGSSEEQMPEQDVQLSIMSNFPAGMALNQISHYIQGTITGIFGPLSQDISSKTNDITYDLTKVVAPIILYYGDHDNLVNTDRMMANVVEKLPNLVKLYKVPYYNFNHLDFIYGSNISLLNEEAIRNINNFTRGNVIKG